MFVYKNVFYFPKGVGDLALALVASLRRADRGRRFANLHPGHPAAARGHVVPLRPGRESRRKARYFRFWPPRVREGELALFSGH